MTINEYRMLIGAVTDAQKELDELIKALKRAQEGLKNDETAITSLSPEEDTTEHAMDYVHLYGQLSAICKKSTDSINKIVDDEI